MPPLAARLSCMGWYPWLLLPSPSTVVTCQPSQMLTGVRQQLTDLARPPSVLVTVTIQAPQPPSPHDTFVPVSSATSLMYWARLSWLDSGQT